MGDIQYIESFINVGIELHVLEWKPAKVVDRSQDFLLLHGLASNVHTWEFVAQRLAYSGHHVFAIDQRGHGLSQKPDEGYDFTTIVADLDKAIAILGVQKPVMAGQSWGGNVLLQYAAEHPGMGKGYIFVDGGYLELSKRGSWEEVSTMLRPPDLAGLKYEALAERIHSFHAGWGNKIVEATMSNFEILPDGTIKPNLSLDHHMMILESLYHQKVEELAGRVMEPALICIADDGSEWAKQKAAQVEAFKGLIPRAKFVWFKGAAHDIHQDRPEELSRTMLDFVEGL